MIKNKRKMKQEKHIIDKKTILLLFILLIVLITLTVYWNHDSRTTNSPVVASTKNNTMQEKNETNSIMVVEENPKPETNGKITDWNLILVNKNNKIPENFNVELEEVEDGHFVDKRIAEFLKLMLSDARKEGLRPIICSSYRTQEKQEKLYSDKVKEYLKLKYNQEQAENLASYWVAIPGTGEHQTGLAVDIVSSNYQILDEEQEHTKEQQWLIDNSYKYGFVLRYPTEKKDLTMINYEPWHYRYVGIENAQYMKEKNICLEEYIEYLRKFE